MQRLIIVALLIATSTGQWTPESQRLFEEDLFIPALHLDSFLNILVDARSQLFISRYDAEDTEIDEIEESSRFKDEYLDTHERRMTALQRVYLAERLAERYEKVTF